MKTILAVSAGQQLLELVNQRLSDLGFAMDTPEPQDGILDMIKTYSPGPGQLAAKTVSFVVVKKTMATTELVENVIAALIAHKQSA
jgi:hypothetical protein